MCVGEVAETSLSDIQYDRSIKVDYQGLLTECLVIDYAKCQVLQQRFPFTELQVEVATNHFVETNHLLTSVILFDLTLFDIKTSHFELDNRCECFIEVIDKQE